MKQSIKGFLWSFLSLLTAAIYSSIPTYLIVSHWQWLNSFTTNDIPPRPVYTIPLFTLFLWIISLVITLIYIVAMIRAIVQRKNPEGLGIPKGVKGFGLISSIVVITFMIIWYILFNEIAFFSMIPQ